MFRIVDISRAPDLICHPFLSFNFISRGDAPNWGSAFEGPRPEAARQLTAQYRKMCRGAKFALSLRSSRSLTVPPSLPCQAIFPIRRRRRVSVFAKVETV